MKKMLQLRRLLTHNTQLILSGVGKQHSKHASSTAKNENVPENFSCMVRRRRSEAQCSVVVQVPGPSSVENVFHDCSAAGTVKGIMFYTTQDKATNKPMNMLLVEFADKEFMEEIMQHEGISSPFFLYKKNNNKNSSSNQSDSAVPVRSNNTDSTSSTDSHAQNQCRSPTMPDLPMENQLSKEKLSKRLQSCESISEQMELYYVNNKATDLGSRLRFLACRQIEVLLSGSHRNATVTPFGSSVNGFGLKNSDLDMVLQLHGTQQKQSVSCLTPQPASQSSSYNNILPVIAAMLPTLTPGCTKISKIMRARVPIIKYTQSIAGLECDLSMSNQSGIYMSELLYQYSALDGRVAPLVCTLRLWALNYLLASKTPGRWITNFSITMLALYYLITVGVLPPMKLLHQHARLEDQRLDENELDCSFLRDMSLLSELHTQTAEAAALSLVQLLHGFFTHYDQFNFKDRGVSIVQGTHIIKPVEAAMYIQNPLDPELNVSRNVTLEEMDRFSRAVSLSLTAMDAQQPSYSEALLAKWMGNKVSPRLWDVDLGKILKSSTESRESSSGRTTVTPALPSAGASQQQKTIPPVATNTTAATDSAAHATQNRKLSNTKQTVLEQ